jgi:hypothetical protein
VITKVVSLWEHVVRLLSCEWLLDWAPNGGAVILIRAVVVAVTFDVLGVLVFCVLDPTRSHALGVTVFRSELADKLHWFGAMFAVAYAALYSRFASQWSYLAGVYNQIKAAEARRDCDPRKIAEWKAGFIVDAHELHLAQKPLFEEIINAWRDDPAVERAYRSVSDRPSA